MTFLLFRIFTAMLFFGMLFPVPVQSANDSLCIVVLGDSLTAGYGLDAQQSFPSQLEKALKERGWDAEVINAGISGDTTAGGVSRLDWVLADDPDLVIVELGGNDALRGFDPTATEANLDDILARLQNRGVRILLTGMRAPRNLGEDYYTKFDSLYPRLADKHDLPFYPFFLEGVAGQPELNLPDGIHPNARGVEVIVEGILPLVESALSELQEDAA